MSGDSCSKGRFASKKEQQTSSSLAVIQKYVQHIQAAEEEKRKKDVGIYSHMAYPPVHCLVFLSNPFC
jgi:hypothetical protein